jgi:hypothetical protein
VAQALQPVLAAAGAPALHWPATTAGKEPGAWVRSPVFNALLLRTLALVLAPAAAQPEPLAAAAARLMVPLWRRARRDALAFAQATPEQQHRTRKRLKRLRYAIEFVAPVLKPRATRKLQQALARALDALGELNDLQLADARFRAQTARDPAAWFVVGYAAARHGAAIAAAAERLNRLRRCSLAWRTR